MTKITRDEKADAMYIQMGQGRIHRSVELHPNVIFDVSEDGTVVGIDVQNASGKYDDDEATEHAANPDAVFRVVNE